MKIETLTITNYRNYDKLHLSFSNNLNIIYGLNGTGKTNLVEAIYLLALTKSFRTSHDASLIKKSKDKTIIEGEFQRKNDTSNFKIELNKMGKKVEINANKIEKLSDYVSKINIVLFSPNDVSVINNAPSDRRKLLNIEISSLYKEYLTILANYNRILKQRNFYLRNLFINANGSKEYLQILTKKLIEYGLMLNKYRQEFSDNINKYISKIYENIFGTGNLQIKYKSVYNNKTAEELEKIYDKYYDKELNAGKTLLGVHHDDLEFKLDGNDLKEWGSEGERKNSIISFKLAELNVIYAIKGFYPILILDDLFSELDRVKINNILTMLNDEVQTFITTTEIDSLNKEILEKSKVYHVIDGTIKEEE